MASSSVRQPASVVTRRMAKSDAGDNMGEDTVKPENTAVSDSIQANRTKTSCPWHQVLDWDEAATKFLGVCASADSSMGRWRPVMKILEVSCHGVPWLLGVVVALMVTHQIHMQERLVNLFLALIIDLVVVVVIKSLFRRHRPAHNRMDMFGTVSVDKFSFPSGHSTRAALVAYFILDNFYLGSLLSSLILTWAVVVSMSRVLLGRHHVLDVLCGFLIGLATYWCLVKRLWLSTETCASLLQPLQEDFHL